MLKISMILRVLLLDTRVLVRRMFESVANTMVLLHYFAKVLRILRFWPDIRVHKGQGSKKIWGSKKKYKDQNINDFEGAASRYQAFVACV